MKKTLLLLVMSTLASAVHGQVHYGTGAGTLGTQHSYFGQNAGKYATENSYQNSYFGALSGVNATTGHSNTGVGAYTLNQNITGYDNIAIGVSALNQNTNGFRNAAGGKYSLSQNTTGYHNTAYGYGSMTYNTTGNNNTSVGAKSLNANVDGFQNVVMGYEAMYSNTSGSRNTAMGNEALRKHVTGTYNTAVGNYAMHGVDKGDFNAAFGAFALPDRNGSYNSAFGANALAPTEVTGQCEGTYNTAVGAYAGPSSGMLCSGATNTTCLGFNAKVTASNQIRLGDTNVTSIGGQVGWTTFSDGRFKRDIQKDVAGLKFINELNPVSYTLDKGAINKFLRVPDGLGVNSSTYLQASPRQVGFIAQEVESLIKKSGYVFSGVEVPQNESDPYTIRYAEFVVPLVKAVQELSAELDNLKSQLKKYEGLPTQTGNRSNSPGVLLYQNSPNPFSATTEIQMEIPDSYTKAYVLVYNLEGKQLKNIPVNDRGKTTINITGNDLNAGMYLYALIVDGNIVDTKRLILTQ